MSGPIEPRIHNPYAKKKSSSSVVARKPLHLLRDAQVSIPPKERRSDEAEDPDAAVPPLEPLSREANFGRNDMQDSSKSSSTMSSSRTNSSSAISSGAQHAAETQQPSNNLPLWQRLPSQTITLKSAEILTIPEAFQRLNDDSNGSSSGASSLRVTGVVRNKCVHADGSVSLVLGDPLAPLRQARRQSSILKRKRPLMPPNKTPSSVTTTTTTNHPVTTPAVAAATETPATNSSTAAATKTPGLEASSASTKTPGVVTFQVIPTKRPQSILFNNSKKKNLVFKKKTTTGRRLSFAAGGLIVKKRTPLEILVQTLLSTTGRSSSSWIWVVVPSNSQQEVVTVNDLVMVMGEVHAANENATTAIAEVTAKLPSTLPQQCYLRARIVRNANGTNMKLHTDALMARRRRAFSQP